MDGQIHVRRTITVSDSEALRYKIPVAQSLLWFDTQRFGHALNLTSGWTKAQVQMGNQDEFRGERVKQPTCLMDLIS